MSVIPLPSARRRDLLLRLSAAPLALALSACAGMAGALAPWRVSTAQLERGLRDRGPIRHSLAGVLDLSARVDGLRLVPERDRLAAAMKFDTQGPLLPQPWHGSFDLLFGLRYEPSDLSLRAHQLEVSGLRVPRVMGRSAELLQSALNAVSQQFAREVVLHRLNPSDVQWLQSLGLRPGPIDVTADGLVLGFERVAAS